MKSYAIFNLPDKASLIFMVTIGPTMVVIAFMFVVRPVEVVLVFFSTPQPSSEEKLLANPLLPRQDTTTDGAVRAKRGKRPRSGENFTLTQALVKGDFLLIFASLILAPGFGISVIDNIGQISQSLGYTNSSIFVSMISIWNFLGRVGGGYLSEIITRDFAYPRPLAMAILQVIMAFGFFYYAMGWPGQIYVVTVLIGLGYGSHWAILPVAIPYQ
uniref:Major facilitator superfamily (MFS) profile domain-containing protein n=1 Tax=Cannabis sativa TaxID=3483 RepID=A0A803P8A2_CANSA